MKICKFYQKVMIQIFFRNNFLQVWIPKIAAISFCKDKNKKIFLKKGFQWLPYS